MNSSEIVAFLRAAERSAKMGFGGEWETVYGQAASHIEAQDKLLAEIAQELRYALIALEWGDIERLHDRLAALSQKDTQ